MVDKLAYAKLDALTQRRKKAVALREVKALKEKLKIAKRALNFYGWHAIVDKDCGYTARVALQKLEDDNGEDHQQDG